MTQIFSDDINQSNNKIIHKTQKNLKDLSVSRVV